MSHHLVTVANSSCKPAQTSAVRLGLLDREQGLSTASCRRPLITMKMRHAILYLHPLGRYSPDPTPRQHRLVSKESFSQDLRSGEDGQGLIQQPGVYFGATGARFKTLVLQPNTGCHSPSLPRHLHRLLVYLDTLFSCSPSPLL